MDVIVVNNDEPAQEEEEVFDPKSFDPGPSRFARIASTTLAALAIGALAFAIGRFTAFDSHAAANVPFDSSPEAGFARDMQTHHQQAVELAMIVYPKTQDDDLRALAYDIATSQSIQLGQMQQWLLDWKLPAYGTAQPMSWMAQASGHEAHGAPNLTAEQIAEQMGMATQEQIASLAKASGTDADCQFLTLMIRHHQGAVEMVDAIEKLGSNATVLDLAGKMSASQKSEMSAMASLQNRFACRG